MRARPWSLREVRSGRARLVGLTVAGLVAVVLVGVSRHTETSEARVRAAVVALSSLTPAFDSRPPVVVSHPSCDDDPPCTSAAMTWTAGRLTLLGLDRALPAWVTRNHLRGAVQWRCGPNWSLFGATGAGCQTSFDGPTSTDAVYLAATFTDGAALAFDPTTTSYVFMPHPLVTLGRRTLASVSVQVVTNDQ